MAEGELLVPCCHAPVLLELPDAPFEGVPPAVRLLVGAVEPAAPGAVRRRPADPQDDDLYSQWSSIRRLVERKYDISEF